MSSPSTEPIIQVENLSKAYRIWSSPSDRIKSPLLATASHLFPQNSDASQKLRAGAVGKYREFYALKNISFSVKRGEATGVIGRNGSGKSTLLQLIAGILTPTSGRAVVRGRVSALLELGSGFNPEFSGVDNVFLNGAILGFSHREVQAKLDDILAFADIGDFIHEPVKLYSSGMSARLAFAVQQALDPDILIVDEALSVGDVFFQQKCFTRIREVLANGATLFYVSHDLAGVQNLCSRAILLHHGEMIHNGSPEECVSRYYAVAGPRETEPAANDGTTDLHPAVSKNLREETVANDILPAARSRHGDRALEFMAASFVNEQGSHALNVEMMKTAVLRLLLRANAPLAKPAVGVQIFDRMANLVFASGTPQRRFELPSLGPGEEIMLEFRITLSLQPGQYTLGLDAATLDEADSNVGNFRDRLTGLGPLTVHYVSTGVFPFYGITNLPFEIRYA